MSTDELRRLSPKQETFCVEYFKTGNATQSAIKAGYSKRTATVIASQNLNKLNVQARLKGLRDEVDAAAIMTVIERQERLSEIARGRLTDFVECGPDGSWVNIGLEGCQSASLQAVKSKTEYDDNGSHPTVITDIKLHDPIRAIAELNKMDGAYAPEKHAHLIKLDTKELTDDELSSIARGNTGGGSKRITTEAASS